MRHALYAVLASLLLVACPTEEPEAEVPDISSHYVLTAQQRDSNCLPEIASPEQITGFMEETPNGVPILSVDLAQEGDSLDGLLDPSGCSWSGLVDTEGSLTLSGPCDDADVGRIGRVAGMATPFGADWQLDGSLTIEVDTENAAGEPGPDGEADCEVILDLAGTGS